MEKENKLTLEEKQGIAEMNPYATLPEKVWESGTIHKTRYNKKFEILEVTFKNDAVYHYKAFPLEKWNELLLTDSIGTYVSQKVKGVHDFNLIKAASQQVKTAKAVNEVAEVISTDVTKIKTLAEKKFEAVKAQGIELAAQCAEIQISDANTLAMATQILSKAKEFDKAVEGKRKELKEPYLQAGKEIDAIAKSITDGITKGLEMGKLKLRAWNESEQLRINEENAANQKLIDYLKKVEDAINLKLVTATTPELCDALIESIKKNFPALDVFGIYEEQAHKSKENYIKLLETRKTIYATALSNSSTAAEVVAEAIEEQNVIQQQVIQNNEEIEEAKAIVVDNNVAITSKVRRSWKFEIIDATKLPREFLSPDDVKIRAYMGEIKEKLEASPAKGMIIAGVRFYLDLAPQI